MLFRDNSRRPICSSASISLSLKSIKESWGEPWARQAKLQWTKCKYIFFSWFLLLADKSISLNSRRIKTEQRRRSAWCQYLSWETRGIIKWQNSPTTVFSKHEQEWKMISIIQVLLLERIYRQNKVFFIGKNDEKITQPLFSFLTKAFLLDLGEGGVFLIISKTL